MRKSAITLVEHKLKIDNKNVISILFLEYNFIN